jgi:hypothetical protein
VLPLPGGPLVTVSFEYQVPLDSAGRRQLGYDLLRATGAQGAWYPTVSDLPDSVGRFSDFEVTLDLPEALVLLSSGTRVDSTFEAGRVRRRLRGEHLEGFALAMADDEYRVRSIIHEGLTVQALTPRADTLTWDRAARETARAARWYRDAYGLFSASTIGIVPGNRGARGGFPLSRMFMIHQGDLSPAFVRWITAHELAHYYWGLYVLSSAERLDWLMLGLGIWTDQWYLSRSGGVSLEAQWRDPGADNSFERLAQAEFAGLDQRLGLPESAADSLPYDHNSLVRHAKAAVGVYLLSRLMGPDSFAAFQRSLLADYRYRPLSPSAFARRLEAAGVAGAGSFLDQWMGGDARLGYAIRGIRPIRREPNGYWIDVERTGTIPYPVTMEARARSGEARWVELSGAAVADSALVNLPGGPSEILIDPDGLLPMWSSSGRAMQAVFLRALGKAGPTEPFLTLAKAHLAQQSDGQLAALVVERLFELGRYSEITRLATRWPSLAQCVDRVTCHAAIQVARGWWRDGHRGNASVLLQQVARAMDAMGLGNSGRLTLGRREIDPRE